MRKLSNRIHRLCDLTRRVLNTSVAFILTPLQENMNLLRDSAQLQTQLRLFENLVDTRHTILKLRPGQRQNWVGLAVAHHLNGNTAEAKKILDHYHSSLKVRRPPSFADRD